MYVYTYIYTHIRIDIYIYTYIYIYNDTCINKLCGEREASEREREREIEANQLVKQIHGDSALMLLQQSVVSMPYSESWNMRSTPHRHDTGMSWGALPQRC